MTPAGSTRRAPLDRADLQQLLQAFAIDPSSWGSGITKTFDHLLTELHVGDCELFIDGDGLARRVRNVWVNVFATVGSERHHLVEQRQVFHDGRVRERRLPASLGEKCKIDEDPHLAARRGLAEELGIGAPLGLTTAEPRENPVGEPSYPGLRTVYDTYWFAAELAPEDYRPEGYIEQQADKRSYFVWE